MTENPKEEIRILVALCNCGINIAGYLEMDELKKFALTLPGVVYADKYSTLCTTAGADFIRKNAEEMNVNRIVVAACTPKTHRPVFEAVLKDMGMDPSFLQFVNIREHATFVHQDSKNNALAVSKDQLRAGVMHSFELEHIPKKEIPVTSSALVIGGGVAGLQSSLDLANQGYQVYLVEEKSTVGGKMAMLDRTFPTDDCSI